jgi:hypothetical protein
MMTKLNRIESIDIPVTNEVFQLAELIIERRILPRRCFNDCVHIAAAIVANCDFLATWNIKHLANFKTNGSIRTLSLGEKEVPLQIIPPSMLTGGYYDTETDNQ